MPTDCANRSTACSCSAYTPFRRSTPSTTGTRSSRLLQGGARSGGWYSPACAAASAGVKCSANLRERTVCSTDRGEECKQQDESERSTKGMKTSPRAHTSIRTEPGQCEKTKGPLREVEERGSQTAATAVQSHSQQYPAVHRDRQACAQWTGEHRGAHWSGSRQGTPPRLCSVTTRNAAARLLSARACRARQMGEGPIHLPATRPCRAPAAQMACTENECSGAGESRNSVATRASTGRTVSVTSVTRPA